MKKSDYQYFCIHGFLDESLHSQMVLPGNQCQSLDVLITEDGNTIMGTNDNVIKNRYKDNSIVVDFLPPAFRSVIEQLKNQLIKQGLKNPIVYNIAVLPNPVTTPGTAGHGWHKDYNPIKDISDASKLWITFLALSQSEINTKFVVSPTADGPGLWNIGIDLALTSNVAIGHNMNLGHNYVGGTKNNLSLMYIRWYDAS